jgi:hypothetical protein
MCEIGLKKAINDISIVLNDLTLFEEKVKDNQNSIAISAVIINNYDYLLKIIELVENKLTTVDLINFLNIKYYNEYDILECALQINKDLNNKIKEANTEDINKLIEFENTNEKIIIEILLKYYSYFYDENKLFKIIHFGSENIINYFINKIDTNELLSLDNDSNNILHYIVLKNNVKIIKNILKKHQDLIKLIKNVNNNNKNCIYYATKNNNNDIIELLSKYIHSNYKNLDIDECCICLCQKKIVKFKSSFNNLIYIR